MSDVSSISLKGATKCLTVLLTSCLSMLSIEVHFAHLSSDDLLER